MSTISFWVLFTLTCIGIAVCVVGLIACVHMLFTRHLEVKKNRKWKKTNCYTPMSDETIKHINDNIYNRYCAEEP